jgi:hypothetical protein
MYGYGYGYGFGCGAEGPLPSASQGTAAPGTVAPLADITAPPLPGIQPGPTPTVPGVHTGLHSGMTCVPTFFMPFRHE